MKSQTKNSTFSSFLKSWKWFAIKNTFLFILFMYYMVVYIAEFNGPIEWTLHWGIWIPITTYVVFWEGRRFLNIYQKMFKKVLDMDSLIGLASHIIFIYSTTIALINWNVDPYDVDTMWEAPAVLIIFTNIGHMISAHLEKDASATYSKLNALKSKPVIKIENDTKVEIKPSQLKVGDLVVVPRGSMIPVDGVLESESGSFDYSNITGESKSIAVLKNGELISGSFNLGEEIIMRVIKLLKDSTINMIIEKIEDATLTKPKLQTIADKMLKYFIPSVLIISSLTFITWLIVGYTVGIHLPWIMGGNHSPISLAIMAGVTVLAIACPCALGMAAPLVYLVTVTETLKNGSIINKAESIESLQNVKYIAFDKTGTITENKLKVIKVVGDKKYIPIAKGLEEFVSHPIAKAIMDVPGEIQKLDEVSEYNQQGREAMFDDKKYVIKKLENVIDDHISINTLIGLYKDDELVLSFELENVIRKDVIETIARIKKMGIQTLMITGDAKDVAESVGKNIGIDLVYSQVTPFEKNELIKKLQLDGEVAFVGDGFNDSIAIKTSNVSIAFASGSEITNSLADISIINDDFKNIYKLFRISKLNNSRVKSSLLWAVLFNVIAIPVAVIALVPAWMGAMIMTMSDILMVVNALMYRRKISKLK